MREAFIPVLFLVGYVAAAVLFHQIGPALVSFVVTGQVQP